MATRIAYAFILLINSIIAWIMLTPWAIKKLQHLTLDYMDFNCGSSECYGYFAVQRINFALGLFHFILGIILLGVRSTRDDRAALQNGFWGPKIIVWFLLIVVSFFIPEGFFLVWGNWFAFAGAMLFVLLGLVLLVDLAYQWAELCQSHMEEEGTSRNLWSTLLVGSTVSMYLSAFAMTVVMYIFFASSGCSMNITAITVNLILMCIVTAISVSPSVQENNPKAGLAQAAMVSVYCTYLTFSAVCMEPDDKNCNPLVRARGARTTTIVLGALVTMLTIAYTTTRAATQGIALGSDPNRANPYGQVPQEPYSDHGLVTTQPITRRQAMLAAVESGSLPASALDEDSDDDEEVSPKHKNDDERMGTQYSTLR